MEIDSKYERITEIVQDELTCSAHNLDHVFRVYNLCLLLAKCEKEVDLDVLIPSALLHDIARVKESQNKTGEIDHAVLGSAMAEDILRRLGYEEEKIAKIKHCIISHRFRTGNEPKTIEAKILFDSDKLDVLGAIGIARTYMLGGQFGQKLKTKEPLDDYLKHNTVDHGRLKDVSKHTALLEYEIKYKKIPEKLYTKKAKEMGLKRLQFMDEFFKRLDSEIECIQ